MPRARSTIKPTASSATASTKPGLARVTRTPFAEAAPTSTLRMSTAQRTKATELGQPLEHRRRCLGQPVGDDDRQPRACSISRSGSSGPPVSLNRTSPSLPEAASASRRSSARAPRRRGSGKCVPWPPPRPYGRPCPQGSERAPNHAVPLAYCSETFVDSSVIAGLDPVIQRFLDARLEAGHDMILCRRQCTSGSNLTLGTLFWRRR